MAKGGRTAQKTKKKRRRGSSTKKRRVIKTKSTSTASTSGRVRPDTIIAPLPRFVHMPNQREVDAKEENTWYYRTPLTINNRYTPTPNRVFEPGRSKADTVWL